MNMQVRAFAPGQITGFFQIFETGSTGASINLGKGMQTEVRGSGSGENEFYLESQPKQLPVSRTVLQKFQEKYPESVKSKVAISHNAELPIGYGTGMSAAGALSLSLSLNEYFKLKLGYEDCVQIAFEAEIENGTGLNGVRVLQNSGLLIGEKPDSISSLREIPIKDNYLILAFLNPIDTKSIIKVKEWVERINAAGKTALSQFLEKPTEDNFIKCSRDFTFETGLASNEMEGIMEEVKNCSMAMLGQTLFKFSHVPEGDIRQFVPYSQDIRICPLKNTIPRIISSD